MSTLRGITPRNFNMKVMTFVRPPFPRDGITTAKVSRLWLENVKQRHRTFFSGVLGIPFATDAGKRCVLF